MPGNNKKWARNKTYGVRGGSNRPARACGIIDHTFGEAVDLEQAALSVNRINARKKRERYDEREARKVAQAKAKITLPQVTFGTRKS